MPFHGNLNLVGGGNAGLMQRLFGQPRVIPNTVDPVRQRPEGPNVLTQVSERLQSLFGGGGLPTPASAVRDFKAGDPTPGATGPSGASPAVKGLQQATESLEAATSRQEEQKPGALQTASSEQAARAPESASLRGLQAARKRGGGRLF